MVKTLESQFLKIIVFSKYCVKRCGVLLGVIQKKKKNARLLIKILPWTTWNKIICWIAQWKLELSLTDDFSANAVSYIVYDNTNTVKCNNIIKNHMTSSSEPGLTSLERTRRVLHSSVKDNMFKFSINTERYIVFQTTKVNINPFKGARTLRFIFERFLLNSSCLFRCRLE